MGLSEIKIAYLKRKLLLEEKKKTKRDDFNKKKSELQKKALKNKELEIELLRRIAKEKNRTLTESDKKRIVERKKLLEQRKKEVRNGLNALAEEGKRFFKFIGERMDEAEKSKIAAMKKNSKGKSKKKRTNSKR